MFRTERILFLKNVETSYIRWSEIETNLRKQKQKEALLKKINTNDDFNSGFPHFTSEFPSFVYDFSNPFMKTDLGFILILITDTTLESFSCLK